MRVVEAGSQVDGSRAQMDGLHIRTELVWNDFKLLHAGIGLLIFGFGSRFWIQATAFTKGYYNLFIITNSYVDLQ